MEENQKESRPSVIEVPQNAESSRNSSDRNKTMSIGNLSIKSRLKQVSSNRTLLKCLGLLTYNVYLGYAIYHQVENTGCSNADCWDWCNGIGFILLVTSLIYAIVAYTRFLKQYLNNLVPNSASKFGNHVKVSLDDLLSKHLYARIGVYLLFLSLVIAFFVWDTWNDQRRLISAAGIAVIVLLGAVFSKHRRYINWRQVTWGFALQLIFGLLILRWQLGKSILDCLSKKVDRFLAFTDDGSSFVYGYLVSQQPFIPGRLNGSELAYNLTSEINSARAFSSVVVFKSLPVIYFFCFVTNILFYFGAVQWVTIRLGNLLRWTIQTTPCESMNAAANIFLGQAVAPLLIKPYIEKLTLSEIHAVITSGFATIAGTVMAAFITFGVSPAHLLSASFMSAPAALACAKLLYPEKEIPRLSEEEIRLESGVDNSSNVLDAATRGAVEGAVLVLHIAAIVVAFIASVAFLNEMVSFFGSLVGLEEINFEWILGKVFMPLVFMMGVEWSECETVAKLVGIKTVVNEFIAYQKLSILMKEGALSPRAVTIATYALCGFANPGSIGVTLASLGGICPQRRKDFSKLVLRAFVAGSMACFMTACIAGALIEDNP